MELKPINKPINPLQRQLTRLGPFKEPPQLILNLELGLNLGIQLLDIRLEGPFEFPPVL